MQSGMSTGSAAIFARPQALLQSNPVSLPDGVLMHHLAELIDDRTVGRWKSRPRVVCEKGSFLSFDDSHLLQLGEVAAQVRLVELQNCLQITDTKCLVVEQIQDAQSIRICQSFKNLGYVHDHRVMDKSNSVNQR